MNLPRDQRWDQPVLVERLLDELGAVDEAESESRRVGHARTGQGNQGAEQGDGADRDRGVVGAEEIQELHLVAAAPRGRGHHRRHAGRGA